MMDPSIENLPNLEALQLIGTLVDRATDERDMTLCDRSFELADELEARGITPRESAMLDYFRANAWACRLEQRMGDRTQIWSWEQPEVLQQVFLLRRASNRPAFDELPPIHRCQILTNLGNQLSTLGRFVEAQALWTRALKVESNFWMARGNRGNGLLSYGAVLYDGGHAGVFHLHAHRDLVEAIDLIRRFPQWGDPGLARFFAERADQIARHVDIEAIGSSYDPDSDSLGETAEERSYRQWCLRNTLFLNPLNDLAPKPIAARDILGLPSFRTGIDEPPVVIGMANDLKQGFVSARWLLYEGMSSDDPHFSDRDVLLYNTLDYPSYGLAVEKVKLAFRIAYSTFDKIAFFLNQYAALGIPLNKVNFRSVWWEKDGKRIRDRFVRTENWPWRGLFWLSKDLFEPTMRESTEPDARSLAEIRNHLEHKYVRVLEMGPSSAKASGPFHDPLVYAISRGDLQRKTLKLLQLVRAALIYCFIGMHQEERRRDRDETTMVAPMIIDTWDDDWKR
jgi:hypothetical protein